MTSKDSLNLINSMRLPMTIGVVFIHTVFFKWLSPEVLIAGGGATACYPILFYTKHILEKYIFHAFIPVFFLFSGYLFFREQSFNLTTYRQKIHRRFFSLVIPYIFWNAVVLLTILIQNMLIGSYSDRTGFISDWRWSDWLWNFIDCSHSIKFKGEIGAPISWPLWFVRDLIYISLLSPIFYYIAKIPKHLGILFLLAIYFSPYHLPHLANQSCFFFGLGVYMQLWDIDLKTCLINYKKIFLIVALVTFTLYFYNSIRVFFSIFRIAEVLLIISYGAIIMDNTRHHIPQMATKSSFFIYASHIIPTSLLCYLVCRFLPHMDLIFTVCYFTIPFIVTLALIAIYYILQRFIPNFTALITGGR